MIIFQSCLWQTNSTVIEGKEACFLFDPTYYPHELAQIKQALPDKCLYVIFTHADWDHIAGFTEFSYGQTIGHYNIENRKDPMEKVRIDEEIIEETTKSISGETVYFLPIPGHTDDMMAVFFPEHQLVVAGDVLSDLEFPFVFYSSLAYIESLQKMKAKIIEFGIHTLIPSHGKAIFDAQPEILKRIEDDLAYLHGLRSGEANASYRQQPIAAHLAPRHRANVEFVENETTVDRPAHHDVGGS